jgi:hypothetical protein
MGLPGLGKIVVAMTKDAGNTDYTAYWRQRAEEVRNDASNIRNRSRRRKIEDIAKECDRMAEWIKKIAGRYSNLG